MIFKNIKEFSSFTAIKKYKEKILMENEKILKQAGSNLKRAKITIDEIRKLIKIGEKIDVEFKESKQL